MIDDPISTHPYLHTHIKEGRKGRKEGRKEGRKAGREGKERRKEGRKGAILVKRSTIVEHSIPVEPFQYRVRPCGSVQSSQRLFFKCLFARPLLGRGFSSLVWSLVESSS